VLQRHHHEWGATWAEAKHVGADSRAHAGGSLERRGGCFACERASERASDTPPHATNTSREELNREQKRGFFF
jgi:hypothetical protein